MSFSAAISKVCALALIVTALHYAAVAVPSKFVKFWEEGNTTDVLAVHRRLDDNGRPIIKQASYFRAVKTRIIEVKHNMCKCTCELPMEAGGLDEGEGVAMMTLDQELAEVMGGHVFICMPKKESIKMMKLDRGSCDESCLEEAV